MTNTNRTHTISGYCPANLQTAKAVRVTITDIDGEGFSSIDTVWLPRSIAEGLTVTAEQEYQGGGEYGTVHTVRATVPAWWVRKLDARPAWVRNGQTRAPSPVGI
jgi:hypothetical protein